MVKTDSSRDIAAFYKAPTNRVIEIDLPLLRYLMIDGIGSPASPGYSDAIATLYPVAFTLKFSLRPAIDFKVGPLETLWWVDSPGGFQHAAPEDWRWTALSMVPEAVTAEHVDAAASELRRKAKPAPLLDRVRVAELDEGLSVQIMHVGPYDAEAPTIQRLHDYITDNGFSCRGHHHEIYLSDPRRTAPERLRTLIRQPVH